MPDDRWVVLNWMGYDTMKRILEGLGFGVSESDESLDLRDALSDCIDSGDITIDDLRMEVE
jgi:hypothetical protein